MTKWLDRKHVVFGEVANDQSMAVVKAIVKALGRTGSDSGQTSGQPKIVESGQE